MTKDLLIEYLDRARADYVLQVHSVAYTAPEIAQSSHVHGRNFAKVVIVKVDGELTMVVLPAHYHIEMNILRDVLGADEVVLATEKEFKNRFPRCETGAMPPFGHLFGLQAYMVPVFIESEEIVFNAGTHTEIVRMPYREYLRLAHVTDIAQGVIPPILNIPDEHRRRHRYQH